MVGWCPWWSLRDVNEFERHRNGWMSLIEIGQLICLHVSFTTWVDDLYDFGVTCQKNHFFL